jgi:hypothetical protein
LPSLFSASEPQLGAHHTNRVRHVPRRRKLALTACVLPDRRRALQALRLGHEDVDFSNIHSATQSRVTLPLGNRQLEVRLTT